MSIDAIDPCKGHADTSNLRLICACFNCTNCKSPINRYLHGNGWQAKEKVMVAMTQFKAHGPWTWAHQYTGNRIKSEQASPGPESVLR